MNAHRITLVGIKGSGKSTWLGAFFDALHVGECQRFETTSQQPSDRSAVQLLVAPIQEGRYASRTPDQGAFPTVRLRTVGSWSPVGEFALEAADYRGEQLEKNFDREDRAWGEEWDRRSNAHSFIVVLRPNDIAPLPEIPAPSTAELESIRSLFKVGEARKEERGAQVLAPADVAPVLHDGASGVDDVPRGPAPTLLVLIEVLQMIRARRGWAIGERPSGTRLSVVLTAWDALDSHIQKAGPDACLRDRFPLLNDFIWSNFDPDFVRCFGLSATGGDLDDPDYRTQYMNRVESLAHVCWSASGDVVHTDKDLSLPFAWALAGDTALKTP